MAGVGVLGTDVLDGSKSEGNYGRDVVPGQRKLTITFGTPFASFDS